MVTQVFKHSIVAYIKPVFKIILAVVVAILLTDWIRVEFIDTAITIAAAVYCLVQLHRAVSLYFDRLVINEDGAWRCSGYLPWEKGSIGRNWDEIGDVVFLRGFVSWLFDSFTVVIESKYRDHSYRIVMDHIREGDLAVTMINTVLEDRNLR